MATIESFVRDHRGTIDALSAEPRKEMYLERAILASENILNSPDAVEREYVSCYGTIVTESIPFPYDENMGLSVVRRFSQPIRRASWIGKVLFNRHDQPVGEPSIKYAFFVHSEGFKREYAHLDGLRKQLTFWNRERGFTYGHNYKERFDEKQNRNLVYALEKAALRFEPSS